MFIKVTQCALLIEHLFIQPIYIDPCFELSELLRQHFVIAAVALYVHHKMAFKKK